MKIRRYIGNNIQEAILKVKMDLGSEAVILNTRKVRKKGIQGLFSKPLIEVLAAVDEEYVSKAEKVMDSRNEAVKKEQQPQNKNKFGEKEEKLVDLENKVNNMELLLQKIYNSVRISDETVLKDEVLCSTGPDRVKEPEPKFWTPPVQTAPQRPQQVEQVSDLLQRKHILQQSHVKQAPRILHEKIAVRRDKPAVDLAWADTRYPHILQFFYKNLQKNEVHEEIITKIMDAVSERVGKDASFDDALSALYNIISEMLGKPETIQLRNDGKPTVVIFVGPTGVGKTTTLAKVAANYALNYKKNVGLITADTYRIAAVEQLKTYAEIMGLPVTVVYSPYEIREAINTCSDKDIILIDTAGRSHYNKQQFEELKTLVSLCEADETFLLLSATTSFKNCMEILNTYSFLKDYKIIFTKVDETQLSGVIFNIRHFSNRKLSYVTTGQSVPDDIEILNTDKLTKKLLGSIN